MDGNQVSNQTRTEQLAQALMLEQVKFTRQRLINTESNLVLDQFIDQLYLHADSIKLLDIVELEQLNQVVSKYAFELNLGPDLLEFIGFVAQNIHQYLTSSQGSLNDFLSDENFESWLDKILELDQARIALKNQLLINEKAQQVSLQLANQILEKYTPWLNQLRKTKYSESSIKSRFLTFLQEQQQNIEYKLENQLSQAILIQLGEIITLPKSELSEIAQHIWSDLKMQKIAHQINQIEAIDVEDFFILIYENWKDLRESDEIQGIVLAVVKTFYEYFGDYSLKELLNAVGLEKSDLLEEAYRFAPHTIKVLDQFGLLEKIIYSLIAPFYQSQASQQLIQQFIDPQT
jgi:hypothetical protein